MSWLDLNLIRTLVTVVSLGVFLGICRHAYRRTRRPRYDAIARSILHDDTTQATTPNPASYKDHHG
jgi:cbb3-type cytochrome oxidase subunit 3